jgi:hypothetical protein
MRGLNPKFLYNDGERVFIDVRRAALAGAREVEVCYVEATNTISVKVHKQLQSQKESA